MRLVFLSGCNTQQRTIINSLSSIDQIDLSVVRLLPDQFQAATDSRLARLLRNPLKVVSDKLNSWNFTRRESARSAFMQRRFGAQEFSGLKEIVIARSEINSSQAVNWVAELRPEILIVCGSPILKQPIISTASSVALNIHFGSAPRYRGEHCLFWALMRGDYEHLEVTVHQLTAALDHGAIFIQGRPQLTSSMHEFEIEARMVEFLCAQLGQLVSAIAGGKVASAEPLAGQSELFKLRDRTFIADLKNAIFPRRNTQIPAKLLTIT